MLDTDMMIHIVLYFPTADCIHFQAKTLDDLVTVIHVCFNQVATVVDSEDVTAGSIN